MAHILTIIEPIWPMLQNLSKTLFLSIFNLSPFLLLFIIYLFSILLQVSYSPSLLYLFSPFILLHLFYSPTPLFSSLSQPPLLYSFLFFSITSISSSLFSSFHNHLFSFSSSIILPPVYLFCLSLHLVSIFTVTYPPLYLSSLSFLNFSILIKWSSHFL